MISVKNLTICFDKAPLLSRVEIDINENEFVSIIGLSGSGKTTLLRCITGLEDRYEGSINIKGQIASHYFKDHRIPAVSQKYSNFHWLTAYENIALSGASPSDIAIIFKELGLAEHQSKYINELSGGMQQRVAIGRALLQKSDIIAMDEPFGALDIKTRYQLQDLLKAEKRKHAKSFIFVTHDIEEAIYLSDKVYAIDSEQKSVIPITDLPFSACQDHHIKQTPDFLNLRQKIQNILL